MSIMSKHVSILFQGSCLSSRPDSARPRRVDRSNSARGVASRLGTHRDLEARGWMDLASLDHHITKSESTKQSIYSTVVASQLEETHS